MICGLCFAKTELEYEGWLKVRAVCNTCLNAINTPGLHNPHTVAFKRYNHIHYQGRYWLLIEYN